MIQLDIPDVRAAVYAAWTGDPEEAGQAFQEWLEGVRRDAARAATTELMRAAAAGLLAMAAETEKNGS